MQSRPYSFVFRISYFGARYKGWAAQPAQPTIQGKLERVIRYILGHDDFSLIGASRTDSGVTCREGYFQIFFREKLDAQQLSLEINQSLPQDIQVGFAYEVPVYFNLIQSVQQKTYRYYFSCSSDFHPFASAFMVHMPQIIHWEKMKKACQLFVGKHDFRGFCKPSENKTDYFREVFSAGIFESDGFLGQYFPQKIYYFEISGTGFLHHQVRMMMSAIWQIGSGEMETAEIEKRFDSPDKFEKLSPAPANGLVLWETVLASP